MGPYADSCNGVVTATGTNACEQPTPISIAGPNDGSNQRCVGSHLWEQLSSAQLREAQHLTLRIGSRT